jgi:carboxymethylenebutenolidase
MGGGLALSMALEGENIGAVVVYYGGRNRLDSQTARQITAPILGLYGEKDHGIPLDVVQANEKIIKQEGKTVEFIIYPDAPHAFFNDTRASYRQDAAEDAWERTLNWFSQYLND